MHRPDTVKDMLRYRQLISIFIIKFLHVDTYTHKLLCDHATEPHTNCWNFYIQSIEVLKKSFFLRHVASSKDIILLKNSSKAGYVVTEIIPLKPGRSRVPRALVTKQVSERTVSVGRQSWVFGSTVRRVADGDGTPAPLA